MCAIYNSEPFIPPINKFCDYVQTAFKNKNLTNQGELLTLLEEKLAKYLKISKIQCVTNATTGLQIAIKALEIEDGEIITTPFSYVATTSSILAEKITPVYADIEPKTFNINTDKIEELITPKTKAIMPVHIFGRMCDVEKIEGIAKKHNLKVIYDAAHAFGLEYNGKSILEWGDISVLSFQETKLFQTAEGGALYTKDKELSGKIELIKKCGHDNDNYICEGINARFSELHAALGLANLEYIDEIIEKRKSLSELYDSELSEFVELPQKQENTNFKYPYYVILLKSQEQLERVNNELCKNEIYGWHCYYPSLNKLPYIKKKFSCPVAEDIASRIFMLPLHFGLSKDDIIKISGIVREAL